MNCFKNRLDKYWNWKSPQYYILTWMRTFKADAFQSVDIQVQVSNGVTICLLAWRLLSVYRTLCYNTNSGVYFKINGRPTSVQNSVLNSCSRAVFSTRPTLFCFYYSISNVTFVILDSLLDACVAAHSHVKFTNSFIKFTFSSI